MNFVHLDYTYTQQRHCMLLHHFSNRTFNIKSNSKSRWIEKNNTNNFDTSWYAIILVYNSILFVNISYFANEKSSSDVWKKVSLCNQKAKCLSENFRVALHKLIAIKTALQRFQMNILHIKHYKLINKMTMIRSIIYNTHNIILHTFRLNYMHGK